MAAPDLHAQILEHFGLSVAEDEKLAAELANMSQMFNMPIEDLLYKWEALSFSTQTTRNAVERVFTMEQAANLKQDIQHKLQAQAAKKQMAQGRASLSGMMSRGRGAGMLGIGTRRPGQPIVKTEPGVGSSRVAAASIAGPSRVQLVVGEKEGASNESRTYRYMYEKVSERSEMLDNQLDEFAEIIQKHYNIAELGDPAAPAEEECTVVGRIVLDSESSASGATRLNEASLVLEPSRLTGSGNRVPLSFAADLKLRGGAKGAGGIGLFPGAIIALKGKNGGGGRFTVTEILANPSLTVSSVKSEAQASAKDPFSMVIASAPFTPDADLKYRPWRALLNTMKTTKPAVLLLIGPFIDHSHTLIKQGDVDGTPAQMFASIFTEPLREFLDVSPGSTVLLVPGVRDIISAHAVYPQGELAPEYSGDPRIHLLPNPSRFSINGVSFGTTSVDVLFHLRKEEHFSRCSSEIEPVGDASAIDPMSNLCRQLISQRSFYPVFPVPGDMAREVNLDVSHASALRMGDSAPHALIVPSRLKHFAKVVDGVTMVNPGTLAKGMYATVNFDGGGLPTGLKTENMKIQEDTK